MYGFVGEGVFEEEVKEDRNRPEREGDKVESLGEVVVVGVGHWWGGLGWTS